MMNDDDDSDSDSDSDCDGDGDGDEKSSKCSQTYTFCQQTPWSHYLLLSCNQ